MQTLCQLMRNGSPRDPATVRAVDQQLMGIRQDDLTEGASSASRTYDVLAEAFCFLVKHGKWTPGMGHTVKLLHHNFTPTSNSLANTLLSHNWHKYASIMLHDFAFSSAQAQEMLRRVLEITRVFLARPTPRGDELKALDESLLIAVSFRRMLDEAMRNELDGSILWYPVLLMVDAHKASKDSTRRFRAPEQPVLKQAPPKVVYDLFHCVLARPASLTPEQLAYGVLLADMATRHGVRLCARTSDWDTIFKVYCFSQHVIDPAERAQLHLTVRALPLTFPDDPNRDATDASCIRAAAAFAAAVTTPTTVQRVAYTFLLHVAPAMLLSAVGLEVLQQQVIGRLESIVRETPGEPHTIRNLWQIAIVTGSTSAAYTALKAIRLVDPDPLNDDLPTLYNAIPERLRRLPLSFRQQMEEACMGHPSEARCGSCWNPGCRNLGGLTEDALPTRKCSKCLQARYCSTECQRQHYSDHKSHCVCVSPTK